MGVKPSLSQIVDMASKMQAQMKKMHAHEDLITVTKTSDDGSIKVVVNGRMRVESIEVTPDHEQTNCYEIIAYTINQAILEVEKKLREQLMSISNEHAQSDE